VVHLLRSEDDKRSNRGMGGWIGAVYVRFIQAERFYNK